MEEVEPVTWCKKKYTEPKRTMRYKSTGGNTGTKSHKRRKVGGGPGDIEHVKVITASGKVRWDARSRQK